MAQRLRSPVRSVRIARFNDFGQAQGDFYELHNLHSAVYVGRVRVGRFDRGQGLVRKPRNRLYNGHNGNIPAGRHGFAL